MDFNTGVNQDVETKVDASSTSTTTEQTSVSNEPAKEAESDKSADSLNTDGKKSENVPYNRFKEVNDKYRQTEKELNEYKTKMKYWESVEGVVSKNPVFTEKLNGLIDDYNAGKLTPKQEKQVEQMVQQQQETVAKDPRVDELYQKYQRDTFNKYDSDFKTLVSKDFEDAEDIAMVGKMLTDIINKENPNALDQYDPSLVSKHYAIAKSKVDALIKRQMGKYINSKASDNIPTNKPSVPPSNNVDLRKAPRSEVSSYLAERLAHIKE